MEKNKFKLFVLVIFVFEFLLVTSLAEKIYILEISGTINQAMADYVTRNIREANLENAEAVIIVMDTPGGLMKSMEDIVKEIMNSEIPIITFVYPSGAKAGSAGSFIVVASHVAAMAPGTTIGSATPIGLQGEKVPKKVILYAESFIKSIAEKRGRNSSAIVRFVREGISFTEKEALNYNVIDLVANDLKELFDKLEGYEVKVNDKVLILKLKGKDIEIRKMNFKERFLKLISEPSIAYILFIIGLYGIIFELANPGAILPGVVGGISILLALYGLSLLNANVIGIGLILLSLILFLAEIFTPTHGLLTIGASISLILGSLILFDIKKEPYLYIPYDVIYAVIFFTVGFFLLILFLVIRVRKKKVATGKEAIVGKMGIVIEDLKPEGLVRIDGEIWKAISAKGDHIKKGERVRVVDIKNLTLYVEKVR